MIPSGRVSAHPLRAKGTIGADVSDASPSLRDGRLRLDETGEVVRPGMTGPEFERLEVVRNAGYRAGTYTATVRLGILHVNAQAFHVAFDFTRGRLRGVQLSLCFDDPAREKPWDYATELARKQAHEQWCARQLGEPLEPLPGYDEWPRPEEVLRERAYPWGRVRSIYDSKGGFSALVIAYDEPAS